MVNSKTTKLLLILCFISFFVFCIIRFILSQKEFYIKQKQEDTLIFDTFVDKMTDRARSKNYKSVYYNKILLGYYGRPGIRQMGILGQYSPTELIQLLLNRAEDYSKALNNMKIIPTFHIIYGMASKDPQADNSYLIFLDDKIVMEYIEIAQKYNFAVILDVQIGNRVPIKAVRSAIPYLKYKNVHLAIDPEFAVHQFHNIKPGKYIGHITGREINEVQSRMHEFLKKNNIKENKILIVHAFRHKMIRKQFEIKTFDNIDLTVNMDGHGHPAVKINVFNNIMSSLISTKAYSGFKVFLMNKNEKPVMTTEQSLGINDYKEDKPLDSKKDNSRLRFIPNYINIQ